MKVKILLTFSTVALFLTSLFIIPSITAFSEENENIAMMKNVSHEKVSFEELYSMSEEDFREYCQNNALKYMPSPEANFELQYGDSICIMVRIEEYAKTDLEDITYATDVTQIDTSNLCDYNVEKLVSDLCLPEKYYDFFDVQFVISYDAPYYIKLAQIPVNIKKNIDFQISDVRMFQMIEAWTSQQENVFQFIIMHSGKNTTNDETVIEGDVNCDGSFGVSDIILFQKWLLNIPNIHLENWKAIDYNNDGILNVIDLCLMKRKLLN